MLNLILIVLIFENGIFWTLGGHPKLNRGTLRAMLTSSIYSQPKKVVVVVVVIIIVVVVIGFDPKT